MVTLTIIALPLCASLPAVPSANRETLDCSSGHLAAAIKFSGAINACGLATGETAHVSGFAFQAARSLDAAAQPTNTTFNVQGSAFGVRRSFDPAGRLASVTASAGHSAAPFSLAYSPHDGGLAAVSNAVLSETRSRDLLGNVTNITYRNASGATVGQFRYRYDDTGLVTQKVATVGPASPPVTNAYTYDMLGRLTAADGVAYAYDPAGNRLSVSSVFSVVNNTYTHNRLDGVLHDAAGNVTRIVSASSVPSVRELTWNTQNQLVSVTTNGIPAESYTYDPLGRRLSTTDTSGTVYHVYDGDHCAADVDATGTPLRTYTWGPGIDNLLAVTVFSSASTNTYYAIKDHLGTVHALIDASGQLAAQFTYDAWGNVQLAVGSGQLARSSRFLWQGREYSGATGLYNFRARWYAPEFGRWLSPDPIGIEGGLNLYEFCHNDPVNFRDPSGEVVLVDNLVGAGVGTVLGWVGGAARGYRTGASGWDLAFEIYRGGAVGAVAGFMYESALAAGTTSVGMGLLGAGLVGAEAGLMDRAMGGAYYGCTPSYGFGDLAGDVAGGAAGYAAGQLLGQAINSVPRHVGGSAAETPVTGQKVFRVWGQEPSTPDLLPQQSGPWGQSWTPVDPRTVPNYRNAAGLPDNANLGRFVSEGRLIDTSGVTARKALRIGNNAGKLDELVVPNPARQIILDNVSGVNPPF